MRTKFVSALKITLGILLLIVGAILGPIPIVQGWIFGILGFYLLATEIPWVKKHYDNFKAYIKSKIGHDPEVYVRRKMRSARYRIRNFLRSIDCCQKSETGGEEQSSTRPEDKPVDR